MLTPCEICNESTNFTYRSIYVGPSPHAEALLLPLCKACLGRPHGLEGYRSIERPRPGYTSMLMKPGSVHFQNWLLDDDQIRRCDNCQESPAWPAYVEKNNEMYMRDECIGRFCKQCLMNKIVIGSVLNPVRTIDYVVVHHIVLRDTRLAMWMLDDHPIVKAVLRNFPSLG